MHTIAVADAAIRVRVVQSGVALAQEDTVRIKLGNVSRNRRGSHSRAAHNMLTCHGNKSRLDSSRSE